MWRNLKFFEEHECGDVFSVLNDYLENLLSDHKELRKSINTQKIKLEEINKLIENDILFPFEDLVLQNDISKNLLREYKITNFKLIEINSIMNKYILDYKKSSIKFFKRVLVFNIEKENYNNCKILQKVIDLLSVS